MSDETIISNNAPLISVVIPVYKIQDDLPRCIESICNQTYSNLEILLVDDGSPDQCGMICDEYERKDTRIKVIHKENGGLSDARNVALDILTGRYVTFVDGDDYIAKDYIEVLYGGIVRYGVKISVCNEQRFGVENGKTQFICMGKTKNSEFCMSTNDGIKQFLYQGMFETSAWGKMYESSLFENIRYPKGKQFEDLATTYKLFLKCNKIVFINQRLYFYQIRMNSQMRSSFNIGKMDGVEIAEGVREELKFSRELYKAANCRCLSMYFHVLLDIPSVEYMKLQRELWNKIKATRCSVIFDINARTKARIAGLLSFGGIHMCRFIFKRVK